MTSRRGGRSDLRRGKLFRGKSWGIGQEKNRKKSLAVRLLAAGKATPWVERLQFPGLSELGLLSGRVEKGERCILIFAMHVQQRLGSQNDFQ